MPMRMFVLEQQHQPAISPATFHAHHLSLFLNNSSASTDRAIDTRVAELMARSMGRPTGAPNVLAEAVARVGHG
jgi:hypothetical protein